MFFFLLRESIRCTFGCGCHLFGQFGTHIHTSTHSREIRTHNSHTTLLARWPRKGQIGALQFYFDFHHPPLAGGGDCVPRLTSIFIMLGTNAEVAPPPPPPTHQPAPNRATRLRNDDSDDDGVVMVSCHPDPCSVWQGGVVLVCTAWHRVVESEALFPKLCET